jgi:predicted porin
LTTGLQASCNASQFDKNAHANFSCEQTPAGLVFDCKLGRWTAGQRQNTRVVSMQLARRWDRLVGQWPIRAAASALLFLTFGPLAKAQFSRYADEIEIKGLDLHPRPSLLRETGTLLYGVIDLGLVAKPLTPPSGRCGKAQSTQVAGITPSLFGLQASEMLPDGWVASVRLEHGLNAASGLPANDCGLFFDRAATLGLARRRLGRLEWGRQDHPAYAVARLGDPWSGNGPASPGDTSYYARPVAADGCAPAGSLFRVRAPQAMTFTSPDQFPLWLQVQASLTRTVLGSPDPQTAADEREYGAALHWQTAEMHAAAGYQRWNRETWAVPVSLNWAAQRYTGHLGVTWGQRANGSYNNVLIGVTIADDSGARPGLSRLGLNLHHDARTGSSGKFGFGHVWPLSRRTQIRADAGMEWSHAEGGRPLRAGVALQHQFSL